MNIVVGVDPSGSSRVAEELVACLRWPRRSHFVLLTLGDEPRSVARRDLAGRPDGLAERLRQAGHTVEVHAEAGPAGRGLRELAAEAGADLIVVGSRGRGVVASAVGGSVSADLVDHAPCPVLVARRPSVDKVLVATDGSPGALAIPTILSRWKLFRGLPISVLSVAPRPPAAADFMVTAWAPTSEPEPGGRRQEIERHHQFVERMVEELSNAGLHAGGHVRIGDAAREIVDGAAELGCDLIVTGSRGVGDLQRLLTGSVAHRVLLHAPCSVLILRGHVPARADQRAVAARRQIVAPVG
jgi:nucleotide-binding universal stress UspA family protein